MSEISAYKFRSLVDLRSVGSNNTLKFWLSEIKQPISGYGLPLQKMFNFRPKRIPFNLSGIDFIESDEFKSLSDRMKYKNSNVFVFNGHYSRDLRIFNGFTDEYYWAYTLTQMFSVAKKYEVVLLLACSTAIYPKEFNLIHLLKRVGVKYIISSLWDIEDDSAILFGRVFINNLKGGLHPINAFDKALFELENLTDNPYFTHSYIIN